MQGPMAQAPQMQMMNGQIMMNPQQQQALQQQQRLHMLQQSQQAAAAQRMNGAVAGGHQLSPQQLMQAQMLRYALSTRFLGAYLPFYLANMVS